MYNTIGGRKGEVKKDLSKHYTSLIKKAKQIQDNPFYISKEIEEVDASSTREYANFHNCQGFVDFY